MLLAVLLAGLAGTLAVIAWLASQRYPDPRLLAVAGAFGVLAGVGVLALIAAFSPLYGEDLRVEDAPLALLVAAVCLLYFSVVRGRPGARTAAGHG